MEHRPKHRTIADAAKIFYAAGENWTMPSEGWDMTNFGLFSGDDELGGDAGGGVGLASDVDRRAAALVANDRPIRRRRRRPSRNRPGLRELPHDHRRGGNRRLVRDDLHPAGDLSSGALRVPGIGGAAPGLGRRLFRLRPAAN